MNFYWEIARMLLFAVCIIVASILVLVGEWTQATYYGILALLLKD